MSSGHDHTWAYADTAKVERVMNNPAVEQRRWRMQTENNEYDLPYLAGYSEDGTIIYFDRHLPEELSIGTKIIRPREFIRAHENIEKAVIDGLGWQYQPSHVIANAVERRGVLKAGFSWNDYRKALSPYIKADEHERLVKVPPDLDMTPYYAPPVNRRLIDRMRKAQGDKKRAKDDPKVHYSDIRGKPYHHCGPDSGWPRGYCEYYGNHDCKLVTGYIHERGGCDLWERAEGA